MEREEVWSAAPTRYATDPASLSWKELHELHRKLSTEFADRLSEASTAEDVKNLHALHLRMQEITEQIRLKT